jgi:uncharacterized repeat protein (TIGR01451 family)
MFAKLSSTRAALVRVAALCCTVALSAGVTNGSASAAAVLDLTKDAPATISDGQSFDYTITLSDTGTTAATGIAITDHLPSPATFESATPSEGTFDPNTGVWIVGTVAANGTETLNIALLVANFVGSLSNTAAVTAVDNAQTVTSNTVTTMVTGATPLPAALPLFATGLGALGLLGWRRKRKARVSLLGVA